MNKKYEFMDKSVEYKDAAEFTKKLLDGEIRNLDKSKSLKIRLR